MIIIEEDEIHLIEANMMNEQALAPHLIEMASALEWNPEDEEVLKEPDTYINH